MFHMLTCFDLKPGIGIEAFRADYLGFVEHMRSLDLVACTGPIGQRQRDTRMDTDYERDHEYFVIMSFRDRSQADAAYALLAAREESTQSGHEAIHSRIRNQVFICWQDME